MNPAHIAVLLGVAIGGWIAIRRATRPRQRAFMIRFAIVTWLALALFVALTYVLPARNHWFLWIPFAILMATCIFYVWPRLQRFRDEAARDVYPDRSP